MSPTPPFSLARQTCLSDEESAKLVESEIKSNSGDESEGRNYEFSKVRKENTCQPFAKSKNSTKRENKRKERKRHTERKGDW
jgi:hypothetical protein